MADLTAGRAFRALLAPAFILCGAGISPRALAQGATDYPIPSSAREPYSPIAEGFVRMKHQYVTTEFPTRPKKPPPENETAAPVASRGSGVKQKNDFNTKAYTSVSLRDRPPANPGRFSPMAWSSSRSAHTRRHSGLHSHRVDSTSARGHSAPSKTLSSRPLSAWLGQAGPVWRKPKYISPSAF